MKAVFEEAAVDGVSVASGVAGLCIAVGAHVLQAITTARAQSNVHTGAQKHCQTT